MKPVAQPKPTRDDAQHKGSGGALVYSRRRLVIGLALRVVAVIAISCGLAATVNAVSPRGIAWSGTNALGIADKAQASGLQVVDLATAQQIVAESNRVILDARNAEHYARGHLPNALSLPIASAAEVFADLQILLTPDQPVLVYCSGKACDESLHLGEFLRAQGLQDVAVFEGGMEAWKAARLPVEVQP